MGTITITVKDSQTMNNDLILILDRVSIEIDDEIRRLSAENKHFLQSKIQNLNVEAAVLNVLRRIVKEPYK